MWQVIASLADVTLIIGILVAISLLLIAIYSFFKDYPNRKRTYVLVFSGFIVLIVAIAPSIVSRFTPLPFLLPSGSFQCVQGQIVIDGSTAMQPLIQHIANDYMSHCSQARIITNGGGSEAGLDDVEGNVVQIGDSDVFRTEIFAADTHTDLEDYVVAAVPYVLMISQSPQQPLNITNLTKNQIQGIYTGRLPYANWDNLGGPDLRMTVVSREPGSGTRSTFDKYVLPQGSVEMTDSPPYHNYPVASKTEDVAMYMSRPGAIGYVTAYEALNSGKLVESNGVTLNIVDIDGYRYNRDYDNNNYTFWNLEHMFIKKASATDTSLPSYKLALAFVNYMGSARAKSIITTDSFLNWENVSSIWSTHYSG